MKKHYFTKAELALWICSVALIVKPYAKRGIVHFYAAVYDKTGIVHRRGGTVGPFVG